MRYKLLYEVRRGVYWRSLGPGAWIGVSLGWLVRELEGSAKRLGER
jgi:hypothetical protein